MKLIVQPRDGFSLVISAIRRAKESIAIAIFRCDQPELGKALEAAVKRGVKVRALIAHTNRGGEKRLRKMELALLEAGATVARTGDDYIRYHGKFMVIDGTTLFVLGFNFTRLDVTGSRSFGVITRSRADVQQALKLFDADSARVPYEPESDRFVVSPQNARETLAEFIRKARRQLLIYDPKVSDPALSRLLRERLKAGVDVRIIGKVADRAEDLPHEKFPGKRLHVRSIVRDARDVFIGSQSLRKLELDKRREVGIIVRNPALVRQVARIFEADWALTDTGQRDSRRSERAAGDAADERGEAALAVSG